jgi:hypothetical protein
VFELPTGTAPLPPTARDPPRPLPPPRERLHPSLAVVALLRPPDGLDTSGSDAPPDDESKSADVRVALPPLAVFEVFLPALALCPPVADVASSASDERTPPAEAPPVVAAPPLSSLFDTAHPHAAQTKIRASPSLDVIPKCLG